MTGGIRRAPRERAAPESERGATWIRCAKAALPGRPKPSLFSGTSRAESPKERAGPAIAAEDALRPWQAHPRFRGPAARPHRPVEPGASCASPGSRPRVPSGSSKSASLRVQRVLQGLRAPSPSRASVHLLPSPLTSHPSPAFNLPRDPARAPALPRSASHRRDPARHRMRAGNEPGSAEPLHGCPARIECVTVDGDTTNAARSFLQNRGAHA